MRSLPHVLAAVFTRPWLIEPGKGRVLAQVVARRSAGVRLSDDEIDERVGEDRDAIAERLLAAERVSAARTGVAVIPVMGTLVHRGALDNSSGMTSTEMLSAKLRSALADQSVGTIVLDIDSPGGEVAGTVEFAAEVSAATKPVVAVANSMAASAAYWIASSADEVVVTPSGEVGSVGVLMVHMDDSKLLEQEGITRTVVSAGEHKAELWGPLTDDARAYLESQAQAVYGEFVTTVARNRDTTPARVRSDFGGGRMLLAADAKRAGMVDRIETFSETLSRLMSGGRVRKRRLRSETIDAASELDILERELDLTSMPRD